MNQFTHTRRSFLCNGVLCSLAVPALTGLEPWWLASATPRAQPGAGSRVLVVLQLIGGNDGLNTVVPFAQDDYYRLRPGLGQARGSLHRLDEAHGLHPALAALAPHFAKGELAIVQGVGTREPERSHFRALELWDRGGQGSETGALLPRTGWVGRLADQLAKQDPHGLHALHLASPAAPTLPLALLGERYFAPSLHEPSELRFEDACPDAAALRARMLASGAAAGELGWLREAAKGAELAAQRMQATRSSGARDYPGGDLARALGLVADLVAGDFGTRLFLLSLGGFDTHARQAGAHAALLAELGNALGAFQRDLAQRQLDQRVLTFVHSEFGRRAAENASGGTDHGAGAPVLLLGPKVRGGLHGKAPRLDALVDGDVPASTDLCAVYRCLEENWMGLQGSSRLAALDLCQRG